MARFIELHRKERIIAINAEMISSLGRADPGSWVQMVGDADNYYTCDESYEEVKKLLEGENG